MLLLKLLPLAATCNPVIYQYFIIMPIIRQLRLHGSAFPSGCTLTSALTIIHQQPGWQRCKKIIDILKSCPRNPHPISNDLINQTLKNP